MKMNITTRINRIVSAYFITTGLGFLLSKDFFAKMISHSGSDPVLINLSGMVHFFIGITILVNHFKWRKPQQIIASLFGVMFFLKGAMLIALPELTLQTGNNPVQVPWLMSVGFIGVGVLVGYYAYFKKQQEE